MSGLPISEADFIGSSMITSCERLEVTEPLSPAAHKVNCSSPVVSIPANLWSIDQYSLLVTFLSSLTVGKTSWYFFDSIIRLIVADLDRAISTV